jgi:nicotinate-nucleotide pyrophosphorylase (carboxylating)
MMIPLYYLLRFIEEDTPFGDITSEAVIPQGECRALITIKEDAVAAGLTEAEALFRYFNVSVEQLARDGAHVRRNDPLLSLKGDAKSILLVERTALNIIGRMSGIATATRKFTDLIKSVNPQCRVAGTRKTAPGLRLLDKKAIALGGGEPHRFSLSDGILIKDNHLAIVPLKDAIKAARSRYQCQPIEVEVENSEEALIAARTGATIIMLDNMAPADVQKTLDALSGEGLREQVKIELSGGISEKNIRSFAKMKVDLISVGALTHSVKNIDVSLDILTA